MSEQTILAVKAPPETSLEVPDPKETGQLQMLIKSQSGQQVEVFICPSKNGTEVIANNPPHQSSIAPMAPYQSHSEGLNPEETERLLEGLEGFSPTKQGSCFLSQAMPASSSHSQHSDGLGLSLEPLDEAGEDYLFGLGPDEGLADLFNDPFVPVSSASSRMPSMSLSQDGLFSGP